MVGSLDLAADQRHRADDGPVRDPHRAPRHCALHPDAGARPGRRPAPLPGRPIRVADAGAGLPSPRRSWLLVAEVRTLLETAYLMDQPWLPNPFYLAGAEEVLGTVDDIETVVGIPLFGLAVSSLVLRYRRADDVARHQIRWLRGRVGCCGRRVRHLVRHSARGRRIPPEPRLPRAQRDSDLRSASPSSAIACTRSTGSSAAASRTGW